MVSQETLIIKKDYYARIEMPWMKTKTTDLSSYDFTMKDLKSYLERGNPDVKKIKVGRKDDKLRIKYKGKDIDLTPLAEFAIIPQGDG